MDSETLYNYVVYQNNIHNFVVEFKGGRIKSSDLMSPRELHASGKICLNGLPSATGSQYILLELCAFVLNLWRYMILVSITLGCYFFWEMYLSYYIAELHL